MKMILFFSFGLFNMLLYGQNISIPTTNERLNIDVNSSFGQKIVYSFIDSIITDSTKIVALGEPTHGDKTSFDFQMGMLKHLTSNKDFRALLLECDQNIIDTVFEYFNSEVFNTDSTVHFMHKVIPPNDVMYNTKEAIQLFLWIRNFNHTHQNNPLIVKGVGFDIKSPKIIYYNFMLPYDSLNAVKLKEKWTSSPTLVFDAWKDIFQWFAINQKTLKLSIPSETFDNLESDIKYMRKVGYTWTGPDIDLLHWRSLRAKYNRFQMGQAIRDSVMASNVTKFLKMSLGKKVILWAHNMHVQAWRPYRLLGKKVGYPTMGLILKEHFHGNYLTVGEDFSDSATFVASPKYNSPGLSKSYQSIITLKTSNRSKASITLLKRKYGINSGIFTWQELKNMGLEDHYIFQNAYVQGVRVYVDTHPDIVIIFKSLYPRSIL